MQAVDHLSKISRAFAPAEAVLVVAALRQDALVWQALADGRLVEKTLSQPMQSLSGWSVASLALLALDAPLTVEDLRAEPPAPLEAGLQQRAMETCERLLTGGQGRFTLADAGLVALGLRERCRLSRSWEGLFDLDSIHLALSNQAAAAAWRSALSCLYGMVSDTRPLLAALMAVQSPAPAVEWACHCILSNPAPLSAQVEAMADLLVDLAPEKQLDWLKQLQLKGWAELAIRLAQTLVNAGQGVFSGLWEKSRPEEIDPAAAPARAQRLQQMASLYQHAGYGPQAISMLASAQDLLLHSLASIQLQVAGLGEAEGAGLPAVEHRAQVKSVRASSRLQTDLVLGGVGRVSPSELAEMLPDESRNPLVMFQQARAAARTDRARAQDLARQAVPLLLAQLKETSPVWARSVFAWDPAGILSLLAELDLQAEGVRCAEAMLTARPADVALLGEACRVCQSAGEGHKALGMAKLAVLLAPEDTGQHRRLADVYESCDDWSCALDERERIVAGQKFAPACDWLDLARAAFHAEQMERAMKACTQALEQEPDCGRAYALAGEIYLRQDQPAEAARHLSRATLLVPEEPQPWLSLAALQQASGEPQRALETLRASVLASPASSELHFALAGACLENGLPSDALPFLQEAARLDPTSPEIAWKLGKTLYVLGHTAQARRTLESARSKWPQHPMVAVADAETLIESGNQEAAIPALEVALQSEQTDPDWYLLYARALLAYDPDYALFDSAQLEPSRLTRALLALQKLLSLRPDHFEAGLLLAETLYAQGSLQESFEAYTRLAEQPDAARPEWRWRVQAGFGRVSLALRQIENAVAALREATQARPEDVYLHQLLAEAYRLADLKEESALTARQTLQLAPDTLANLSWFIEIMTRLGKEADTVDALTTATQLAPEQAGFWNRLAHLKLERAEPDGARQALASLLAVQNLGLKDLRAAAGSYLRLDDRISALSCLEAAAAAAVEPQPELWCEIAELRRQQGNPEGALEAVQQAAEADPDEVALHVFQADLLAQLNRPQAALACLERALRLLESQPASKTSLLSEDMSTARGIHTRFSRLLREIGNLPEALHHAEKALDQAQASLDLRYLAADIARALLNNARALTLAQIPADLPQEVGAEPSETQSRWRLALTALRVEMALEANEDDLAARLVTEELPAPPEEPRYLAIRARLLLWQDDRKAALASYLAAGKLMVAARLPADAEMTSEPGLSYEHIFGGSSLLFMAEAALELERWSEALAGFEQYTREHSHEPQALLRYARAIVICAERQRLCAELGSSTHAPGPQALASEASDRFERIIQAAGQVSTAVEITIWLARGRAVFHPSLQSVPAVARLPQPGEHAAALFSVLRLSKSADNAVRIAPHYPEGPAMLAELALCYREIDPVCGLDAARRATSKTPSQPLYQACQALLAELAGQPDEALQSLETALSTWADEPEWHAWAARISQKLGDPQTAISHWERSLALAPNSVDHYLALGQLYLSGGQATQAVDVLSKASRLAPGQYNLWMLLAQAHRQCGSYAEALRCSHQAAGIDQKSTEPRLMSGEIALQMGKPDTALQSAREALACSPNDAATVLFLSKVLVQKGALAEGLSVIEKSLPQLHASLPVMLERANLVRRLYGPQPALPAFMELSQHFPQEASVLSVLAQTQADCGDFKGAERTAYAAYHLNPELPALNFLLGRLQHTAGQLDQAIHFLSESIRQAPADPEPYLELGQAYLERREHLQALRTYQQAIKVAPRDYRPFYQAAMVMRDSKDYIGAESMLRRAAELAPEDLNIRRQLGAVVALNLVHNSQEANSVL